MKKAIAYIRVSTDDQAEHGYSLIEQEEVIKEYAEKNGYEIVRWMVDEGESGADDTRPVFDEMVYGDISNPPYEYVIVAKSDRIARSIEHYYVYKYFLRKKDIQLVSALEDFGQFGAFSKILEAFIVIMADVERDTIHKRTADGRAQKAKRGGYAGGAVPFGYMNVEGELKIDEEEAPAVRRIFELHDQGMSMRAIRDILKVEGYVGRSGKVMAHSTVQGILNNRPTYEGQYKYGNMDWVQGQHEPILRGDV